MTVGSDRDKKAALQPSFIVIEFPFPVEQTRPIALPVFRRLPRNNTNSCYSHGTLRTLRGSASSCRCNAGKGPLVCRIMLRCPCYQPQWLAVDRCSHAIELVQSAFGNTAVSVRVRGRCSWASGQERFTGPMWIQEPIRYPEAVGRGVMLKANLPQAMVVSWP